MTELLPVACCSFLTGWILGRRRRGNAPNRPGPYSSAAHALPPPPPFVGHHRWFINNPVQIAECGGPCSAGPNHCDCGALWVDVPIRLDEGTVQRGNGKGGPTTPKPDIVPKPQFPSPREIPGDMP